MKFINAGFKTIDLENIFSPGNGYVESLDLPTATGIGKLEINAVYFEHSDGAKLLIISIDTLFIGHKFRLEVENHFVKKLLPAEIFIAASHTHSAPMLDFSKPKLGIVNQIFFDHVLSKTLALCDDLLENNVESEFHIYGHEYQSGIGIGRRKRRLISRGRNRYIEFNKTFMLPNRKANVNQPAVVIRIKSKGGLSVVIWNQACHPVSIPLDLGVSPGFIGFGRELFREKFGFNTSVIFLQGFSGDIRPNSTQQIQSFKDMLSYFLFGRRFITFNNTDYYKFIANLNAELELAIKSLLTGRKLKFEKLNLSREIKKLYEFDVITDWQERSISKHHTDFGDLKIIGISAEVLSEFSKLFCSNDSHFYLKVGCIDDVFGYLPDYKSMKQGGYEVTGFLPYFNIKAVSNKSYKEIIKWLLSS